MNEVRIEEILPKKLVGMSIQTSLNNSKTRDLWSRFMSRHKEITNTVNDNLFSVQYYDEHLDFNKFTPQTIFISWAAVEVSDFSNVPDTMTTCTLAAGLYAVFVHNGGASVFYKTANHIFEEWLPQSMYNVDMRPHFEIMGVKYLGPDNPDSEEDVWVPIIEKS